MYLTTINIKNYKGVCHKNMQTTQHYAKVLDRKISEDMKILKEKYNIENNVVPKIYNTK